MKFEDIMDLIEGLAHSQGYYGRLLEAIHNLDEEELASVKNEWEAQNFKEPVDFILYMEC